MTTSANTTKTTWTCIGSVRGSCGIAHRTEEAADKCCAKDQRDVAHGHPGGGSYSDRAPVCSDDSADSYPDLRAELGSYGWHAVDESGQRWWPSSEAADAIHGAADSAAATIAMATDEPMRGVWGQ